eukprot:4923759-Alexandrium_andersonii.AAC.1
MAPSARALAFALTGCAHCARVGERDLAPVSLSPSLDTHGMLRHEWGLAPSWLRRRLVPFPGQPWVQLRGPGR